jgi:hypothetical protein
LHWYPKLGWELELGESQNSCWHWFVEADVVIHRLVARPTIGRTPQVSDSRRLVTTSVLRIVVSSTPSFLSHSRSLLLVPRRLLAIQPFRHRYPLDPTIHSVSVAVVAGAGVTRVSCLARAGRGSSGGDGGAVSCSRRC